jgi:hypothetical protein
MQLGFFKKTKQKKKTQRLVLEGVGGEPILATGRLLGIAITCDSVESEELICRFLHEREKKKTTPTR